MSVQTGEKGGGGIGMLSGAREEKEGAGGGWERGMGDNWAGLIALHYLLICNVVELGTQLTNEPLIPRGGNIKRFKGKRTMSSS